MSLVANEGEPATVTPRQTDGRSGAVLSLVKALHPRPAYKCSREGAPPAPPPPGKGNSHTEVGWTPVRNAFTGSPERTRPDIL